MRLRHAAALALTGWYLMTPPLGAHDEPLSHWNILKTFDTAAECQSSRQEFVQAGTEALDVKAAPASPDKFHDEAAALRKRIEIGSSFPWAVCIAADDPRLKGK